MLLLDHGEVTFLARVQGFFLKESMCCLGHMEDCGI